MEDATKQKNAFADIHCRGFPARVEYDEDDRIFVGHLTGVGDLVGFHADTLDDLDVEFRISVDFHLECQARFDSQ